MCDAKLTDHLMIWFEEIQLTHWGLVTHICASKPTIIGSRSGLSPRRHQGIFSTNAGILLTVPLGTNVSELFYPSSYISISISNFLQENGGDFVSASMCWYQGWRWFGDVSSLAISGDDIERFPKQKCYISTVNNKTVCENLF